MPPPPPPPTLQALPPLIQRRPTKPRPLRRKIFKRSTAANVETGLDDIIATGRLARAARGRGDAEAEPAPGPSRGAGDEQFVASPLSLSPLPSPTPTWPKPATKDIHKAPARAAASTAPPARPATAGFVSGLLTASLPKTPRFITPQPAIAVGRFPSPPRGRGVTSTTAIATASMPALSPTSPMEVVSPSEPTKQAYSTAARTTTVGPTTPTTQATVSTAAAAATTTTATAAYPTRTKPPNRYPPLIVEVLPDWTTHFRELKKLLGYAPNGRPFKKGVRFIPKSDQEFRIIQRYLTQLESTSGLSWFCYSLPAERSAKVAIRGLPANTEPAQLEEELRELGYVPEHVRSIPARPGRPGCLMFAQLQRTPDLTPGIYETRELLCMPGVTIEAWRGRKGPAQCHRCQQFRHSSHNCHRPIACVRCGENHAARDCQRPREEPATCANCGGAHTANNSACPAFRKEARNRRAGTVARTTAAARPATTATSEPNAPGSLMAAANQPQQTGQKRRRKRGKRAPKAPRSAQRPAPQPAGRPASQSEPTVVAASERRTKAKRTAAPQPAPQPARGHLDPRITTVVGALNRVLMAIQEQRDPIPLILGCIAELCNMYG